MIDAYVTQKMLKYPWNTHVSRPCIATESVYYIPLNLRNYTNYAKYYSKILLCRTINVHSVQLVLTST